MKRFTLMFFGFNSYLSHSSDFDTIEEALKHGKEWKEINGSNSYHIIDNQKAYVAEEPVRITLFQ